MKPKSCKVGYQRSHCNSALFALLSLLCYVAQGTARVYGLKTALRSLYAKLAKQNNLILPSRKQNISLLVQDLCELLLGSHLHRIASFCRSKSEFFCAMDSSCLMPVNGCLKGAVSTAGKPPLRTMAVASHHCLLALQVKLLHWSCSRGTKFLMWWRKPLKKWLKEQQKQG